MSKFFNPVSLANRANRSPKSIQFLGESANMLFLGGLNFWLANTPMTTQKTKKFEPLLPKRKMSF